MGDPTRIGLTGDVMLGRKVDERQRSRPVTAVWGNLLDRLTSLDGLLMNLECCLSTRGRPWTRTYRPFHFRADPGWAIPALDAAGTDGVSLANNHVLDYGADALEDTLTHLEAADIAYTGAGRTRTAAMAPAIVTIDDLTVAVIGFTDNTPEYAAGEDAPGTAHIEIDHTDEDTERAVQSAITSARDADPDLIVASLHWGPNMVTEPPAEFRAFGRWLVDRGVDLIHGHSAHVFQGIEVYDGAPILYDTGDFVDDYAVDRDLRNDRGFLFELWVDPDGSLRSLRLSPTEIYDYAVHAAADDVASWSRERMRDLSAPFGTTFERADSELILSLE